MQSFVLVVTVTTIIDSLKMLEQGIESSVYGHAELGPHVVSRKKAMLHKQW